MPEHLMRGLDQEYHSVSLAFDGRDVIVLNLMLPEIGGLEVEQRQRESGNKTHPRKADRPGRTLEQS
jgi:CheY-like chemotaxis protein